MYTLCTEKYLLSSTIYMKILHVQDVPRTLFIILLFAHLNFGNIIS